MAAPRRAWLVFGFSAEEAAGEPSPGPGPRRLESGPEGIRRVWPAWSYAVLETAPPGAEPLLPQARGWRCAARGRGGGCRRGARRRCRPRRTCCCGGGRRPRPGPGRRRCGGSCGEPPPGAGPCRRGPAAPRCRCCPAASRRPGRPSSPSCPRRRRSGPWPWATSTSWRSGPPARSTAGAAAGTGSSATGAWSRSSSRGWWRPWLACPCGRWRRAGGTRPVSARGGTSTCGAGTSLASWRCPPKRWRKSRCRTRTQAQGLRSCRPPGSSRAPRSFPSRRSRPCWTCPRTWRLVPSAAGPGTRLQSHETGSSTPGAGVNTGSWAMGTAPAPTGPGAWSTWWQRGCRPRRWCAGPGTPTCASWSSEGPKAVPQPSLGAWSKGRHRKAPLLPPRAALSSQGRVWADTVGGFPPAGPQLRQRSCAAASGSQGWGCASDKDRARVHGFIKSPLFVTGVVVLHVAHRYRFPAAPAPRGTGEV